MTSWTNALLFGFLIWLIPFGVAFAILPLRHSWRALFESIMPVVVTLAVVGFGVVYFRRVKAAFVAEGLRLGLLWLMVSVAIDLPLMLSPPINMTLIDYLADVGLTYAIMPIVTTGLGMAMANAAATLAASSAGSEAH
jgi:hypothetical protein